MEIEVVVAKVSPKSDAPPLDKELVEAGISKAGAQAVNPTRNLAVVHKGAARIDQCGLDFLAS